MEDKVFDCYSFVPTRDEEEMNRVERELIIKHSPIYNGSIKADAEFMKLRDIRKALGLKLAEINKIIRLRGISPAYKDLYRVSDFRMV
jgi:excinuclease UvrABC nuclease subunit